MPWKVDILTLYPEMFPGSLGISLAGRALENEIWSLNLTQIRDFAEGKHKNVDDTPTGGGAGMVLRPDVLERAINKVKKSDDKRKLIYFSPRGKQLDQDYVRELTETEGVILLCGRFEGVDQRLLDHFEIEEVSIGDYILSGGEVAATVMLDACIRLLPDVMGSKQSGDDESFENGLLEYPLYTKPKEFHGVEAPEVLRSGNHQKISEWRLEQSLEITKERRPDLYEAYIAEKDTGK